MIPPFEAPTRLQAWLQASRYLIKEGPQLNVVLSISNPGSDGALAREASLLVDAFLHSEDNPPRHPVYPLHTVAETIFPGWEYSKRGIQGVFKTYPEDEYPTVKKNWGTYAYRLLRRKNAKGELINPLETLIHKMRDERKVKGDGAYRACYELGVAEGEYDLPLYNTTVDQKRRRGGPCLSHLSFKLFEGCVHLTAIYRSHDYRYKTLGNLLGLARLQACVAQEVGVGIGSLVVHSTYAYVDTGQGKQKFETLLTNVENLLAKEPANELAEKVR